MHPSIHIRKFELNDVDRVYEAVRESIPELCTWMPWCHPDYSREEVLARIESRPRAWETKEEFSFAIEDDQGRFIGTCGLNRMELENGTGNLGYWVRSSATRHGFGTASVGLLRDWAFANTELHRLEILASVENIASQRVAIKSGASHEGTLRHRLVLHDRRHDCALFAIIKPENPAHESRE